MQPTWDANIDPDLIQAIKSGPIHSHELLAALGASDPESIASISRQLQLLEKMGFIQKNTRGWSLKK